MAKIKMFAVEIEITRRVIVYVDARKPAGAVSRVRSPEGWAEARRHDYEDQLPQWWDDKTMTVIDTREADI